LEDKNRIEKNFIESVWGKVRYLEYKRDAEEKLTEIRRNYNRKRIKTAIGFIAFLILVSTIFFAVVSINIYSLLLLGSFYMGAGLFYESLSNTSFNEKRDKYGSAN
jgi:hypothetical protein